MWISERPPVLSSSPSREANGLDPARLRRWVERLAVPRHHIANRNANRRVGETLASELEREGFHVQLQGCFDNVVALPRERRGPLTIVAAHYDTVPDCPGADDNASGLAVMLECARFARSGVGYIAFNAEEDGLLGSRDFVLRGLPSLGVQIDAVHVLEMVGFRGGAARQTAPLPFLPRSLEVPDFIGLVAKGASNSIANRVIASSASPGLRVVAAKTWGPLHRVVPDITRSDHFPFWTAGVPALLWTDTGNFRNPHYHRVTDTPATLDYEMMREVGDLLCAAIDSKAEGDRRARR